MVAEAPATAPSNRCEADRPHVVSKAVEPTTVKVLAVHCKRRQRAERLRQPHVFGQAIGGKVNHRLLCGEGDGVQHGCLKDINQADNAVRAAGMLCVSNPSRKPESALNGCFVSILSGTH